jgi:hypothetical protein
MAYRKIHDDFWTDVHNEELTPIERYFYLYLITNPKNNQIGLFEFSVKQAMAQTDLTKKEITDAIKTLEKEGRIARSKKTKELVLCNFFKHNLSKSPSLVSHVLELIKTVKDKELLTKIQCIDTVYTHTRQEEEEKEEKKEEEKDIDFLFNEKEFFNLWQDWILYKKSEFGFKYKSHISQQRAISELHKLSGGEYYKAKKIVERSMANGWKGFFALDRQALTKKIEANEDFNIND